MNGFPTHWQLQRAARWIRAGGIIAYPTEAVFGLGCDPGNPAATRRLLELKQRSIRKGLILVASDWQQLAAWVKPLPAAWRRRLNKSWPGPTTWLLPASSQCSYELTGDHETLAVRVSAHPVVRRLCDILDSAIVSTSANLSGQQPARSTLQARIRLGQDIDFLLPGETGPERNPTQIRDLSSGKIIRAG